MKLKIKNLFVQACFVAGGVMALTSCNDFLDREPLSSVTPEVYIENLFLLSHRKSTFKRWITLPLIP